jgi:hypothetical protein
MVPLLLNVLDSDIMKHITDLDFMERGSSVSPNQTQSTVQPHVMAVMTSVDDIPLPIAPTST